MLRRYYDIGRKTYLIVKIVKFEEQEQDWERFETLAEQE